MKKILACLSAVALCAHTARTDVILGWDATGDSSPATYTAETIISGIDTGVSLNTLSRVGLASPGTANSFASNGWNLTDTFNQSDDYVTFTVDPSTGNMLTLTSLDYVLNGSNTAPGTGRWGYSTDGGGSFTFQSNFTVVFSPLAVATWDFGDFSAAAPVEFRFWAFGATSVNGGTPSAAGSVRAPANIAGNDLVLNGTVGLIPEPGSVALLSIGALGVWAFSRRRRA